LLVTRRYIARPLGQLQQSATLIARGDLTVPIDTKRRDEIGRLAPLSYSNSLSKPMAEPGSNRLRFYWMSTMSAWLMGPHPIFYSNPWYRSLQIVWRS
jgi:hypothetical protein